MNEISELLGVSPDQVRDELPKSDNASTVNEMDISLDRSEIETMALVAQTAVDALDQLRSKSIDFETEIRQLSQEMNVLEQRSSSLHHRLSTREHALKLMEPFLHDYAIPSRVIDTIYEGEMDAEWFNALHRVRERTGEKKDDHTKCSEGTKRLRKILILRAVERAKAFYVSRLRMLRRPGVNAQRVQNEMIQGRASMDLMREETPRLAAALGNAYRNTMKWYYLMLFGKYGRWLNRQPLMTMDAPQLLGSSVSQSTGSLLSMTVSAKTVDSFSVGARPNVLRSTEDALPALPMTATLSSSSTPSYPIEVLVRSMLLSLADSFEIESKVADVIYPRQKVSAKNGPPSPSSPTGSTASGSLDAAPHSPNKSASSIASTSQSPVRKPDTAKRGAGSPVTSSDEQFVAIFEPVLTFYGEVINGWISQCAGDFFGLLIVIRLIEKSPLQAWINPWLNSITKNCWSHIVQVCHQQAASIEHAALKASTAASSSQAAMGPHIITQLVSSFLSGTLQLCSEQPEPELDKALKSIVESYELFISKLANGNEKVLYNNYFVMSALLSDLDGTLAKEFGNHFQLLVDAFSASQ